MPPGPGPRRPVELLLDALALRFTEGFEAAAVALKQAKEQLIGGGDLKEVDRWNWHPGALVALELWDFEAWHAIAARQAQVARETGALVNLQFALTYLARTHMLTGDLATAARLLEEDRLIAEGTGNPPFEYSAMMIAAWRGDEALLTELAEAAARQAPVSDLGIDATFAACARSVLNNGLGRHDQARDAVEPMFLLLQQNPAAYVLYAPVIMPELAEAAYHGGQPAVVSAVLTWLSERVRLVPNDWALGVAARVRAFLKAGPEAEESYLESVERLSRTRLRTELARSALLYGEWLRGEGPRAEAREQRDRPRAVHRDGRGSVRGAGRRGARRQRGARPQEPGGGPGRAGGQADVPGIDDRRPGQGRAVQSRDRRPAVHQRADCPVPPQEGLRQARHQLAARTFPCPPADSR